MRNPPGSKYLATVIPSQAEGPDHAPGIYETAFHVHHRPRGANLYSQQ